MLEGGNYEVFSSRFETFSIFIREDEILKNNLREMVTVFLQKTENEENNISGELRALMFDLLNLTEKKADAGENLLPVSG